MKTISGSSKARNRRAFLIQSLSLGIAASAPGTLRALRAAESARGRPSRLAAVIGHTGRGDYGHGLEAIFANRPGIEVVALADPDPEGRVRVAAQIGARRAYADYRELLTQERPQLVSLAMRQADQHHAIGLDVLRAGAHLYVEKPFTRTPAEADELIAEADRRGLKIAVAHTMRMTQPVLRLQQALREGALGELAEVRAYGKQDARAGGEDMMVLGSHLFDLLRLFIGRDPAWCTARVLTGGRDLQPNDRRLVKDNVGWVAGDSVFAHFGFDGGVNATFTSVGHLRETVGHWGLEFHGSRGVARLNCDLDPHAFLRRTTGWRIEGRTDTWEPLAPDQLKSPPATNPGPVGDWLEAIAADREPECSGRNARWAIEMAMGVYRAALGGGRVRFPLAERGHPLG